MSTKQVLFMYSKTILLVDDTPLFIKLAQDFFRREQVNILTAQNGPEAIAVVKTHKPDLVFMDLYMAGGDGDLACQAIKSDPGSKATPVIMVTSSGNPADIERCLNAGSNEILHKPLNREQFLDASRRHLKLPGWSGKRSRIKTPAKFGIDQDRLISGFLSDICVGGVFLETDELFAVNTELHLEFQLFRDATYKRCKGRVAWVNRKGNFKKDYASAGMGIEFIDLKKLDILAIQAWVRSEPAYDDQQKLT